MAGHKAYIKIPLLSVGSEYLASIGFFLILMPSVIFLNCLLHVCALKFNSYNNTRSAALPTKYVLLRCFHVSNN